MPPIHNLFAHRASAVHRITANRRVPLDTEDNLESGVRNVRTFATPALQILRRGR